MKKYLLALFIIPILFLFPVHSVAAASFIYPAGDESFVAGQTYTVSWTPATGIVSLMYAYVGVISVDTFGFACTPSTPCDHIGQTDWSLSDPGQVSITIPASLSAGNYRLAVQFVGITRPPRLQFSVTRFK